MPRAQINPTHTTSASQTISTDLNYPYHHRERRLIKPFLQHFSLDKQLSWSQEKRFNSRIRKLQPGDGRHYDNPSRFGSAKQQPSERIFIQINYSIYWISEREAATRSIFARFFLIARLHGRLMSRSVFLNQSHRS